MGYVGIGGEWESYENQISHACLNDSQNFKKLAVKTLTYNDTLYYALIRNCDSFAPSNYIVQSGDVYLYRSGGGRLNSDVLFFFTAQEFEQIFRLDKNTKTIYSFRTYDLSTHNGKSRLSTLPDDFIKRTDKSRKGEYMNIRISDDGKMVRFLLPYYNDGTWGQGYDIFSFCYFEMPLKDFYKWLQPVAPTELTIQ